MLAETIYLQPMYVVAWGGLGALLGLLACVILANKGYGGEAVAALLLGLVCFPFGLVSIIVALNRPDKKAVSAQQQRDWNIQRQLERQRKQLARVAQQAAPTGFIQCPRCGAQNGEAQGACWQCQLPFQTDEPEVVAAPAVVAPPPVLKPPARASTPSPTPTEIKVRCKACGKKFGGIEVQIARLKACPRCKAAPFESEVVQA